MPLANPFEFFLGVGIGFLIALALLALSFLHWRWRDRRVTPVLKIDNWDSRERRQMLSSPSRDDR